MPRITITAKDGTLVGILEFGPEQLADFIKRGPGELWTGYIMPSLEMAVAIEQGKQEEEEELCH